MAAKYQFISASAREKTPDPDVRFTIRATQAFNTVSGQGAVNYVITCVKFGDPIPYTQSAIIAAWIGDPIAEKITKEKAKQALRNWMRDHKEMVSRAEMNEFIEVED
jgi:hypothetical protein